MKQKWLRRGILGVLIFGLCCPAQAEPTFLGDVIPVSGNGDWSNG